MPFWMSASNRSAHHPGSPQGPVVSVRLDFVEILFPFAAGSIVDLLHNSHLQRKQLNNFYRQRVDPISPTNYHPLSTKKCKTPSAHSRIFIRYTRFYYSSPCCHSTQVARPQLPIPPLPLCRMAAGTWVGVDLWLVSPRPRDGPWGVPTALILPGWRWLTSCLVWPRSLPEVSVRWAHGEHWRSEPRRGLSFVWPGVSEFILPSLCWVVCEGAHTQSNIKPGVGWPPGSSEAPVSPGDWGV